MMVSWFKKLVNLKDLDLIEPNWDLKKILSFDSCEKQKEFLETAREFKPPIWEPLLANRHLPVTANQRLGLELCSETAGQTTGQTAIMGSQTARHKDRTKKTNCQSKVQSLF